MQRARLDRDIIVLSCANDKLQQIRAALTLARQGSTIAIARIKTLATEAAQCVGEDLAYIEQTEVTLEDRCGAPLTSPTLDGP
jgi:hypothetical protein